MTIPLQKSVCIKCINNHPTEPNPWDEIDEDKWEQEGTVCCPGNIGKDDTSIYFIPTSCPYEITHKEGKIKPIPISESVCKQCYQKYGIPWKNDLDKPRKYKEDCPAIRRAFCDSDLDGYDWSQFPTNCPYALEPYTMKLHKLTCIRCINSLPPPELLWDEIDEEQWKINLIDCPRVVVKSLDINSLPPPNCPYVLEHLTQL